MANQSIALRGLATLQPQQMMSPQQALALQGAVMEQDQIRDKVQRQQAERQILSAPDAVDPTTGAPTLASIAKLYSVNPEAATTMAHQRQVTLSQLSQMQSRQMEQQAKRRSEMERITGPVVSSYDLALQRTGGNQEEAQREATRVRNEALTELRKSGMAASLGISDQQLDQMLGAPVDINRLRAMVTKPEELARRNEPKSDLGRLEADYKAGRISKKDYEAIKSKKEAPTMQQRIGEIKIDPEDKAYWAEVLRKGGNLPPGLARSAEGAALVTEVMKEVRKSGTPAGMLASQAEFQGEKAGQRTLGTRTATVEMAVQEAQNIIPIALQASEKVNRTQYPTINSILQAAQKGTGDENVVRLASATNALINVYSRAIAPTGTPTVSDKDHAREIIDRAYSQGQYSAVVNLMQQEMEAARKSPGQVKKSMSESFTGQGNKAPQAAIDYLKAHPEAKDQFKAKYGYLP